MLSSESVENVLTQVIQEKFAAIESLLNERTRRRWAAVEARALGRGGIARVAEATGLSRATISAGLQELAAGPQDDDAAGRLRGPGAGRKALAEHDADLVAALERLVDPATRGDPTGPLRWTCSSAARLSRELQEAGHRVSERSVNRLLHALGYSLQANRKTLEGNHIRGRPTTSGCVQTSFFLGNSRIPDPGASRNRIRVRSVGCQIGCQISRPAKRDSRQ